MVIYKARNIIAKKSVFVGEREFPLDFLPGNESVAIPIEIPS